VFWTVRPKEKPNPITGLASLYPLNRCKVKVAPFLLVLIDSEDLWFDQIYSVPCTRSTSVYLGSQIRRKPILNS